MENEEEMKHVIRQDGEKAWTYLDGDKEIGRLIDGVFKKDVKREDHFYRKEGGYAIAAWVVNDLLKKGCRLIVVSEYDTGNVFSISYPDFIKNLPKEPISHPPFEDQWCIPLTKWKVVK